MADHSIPQGRSTQANFVGNVSKSVLLTRLLPLSIASAFGTLIVAAHLFPKDYDWRVRVISKLTSPTDNPEGYWFAALGLITAMLLALPFAGYVAQRLRAVMPRVARSAGFSFVCGFMLMIVSILIQLAQPVILYALHTRLAYAAAGFFITGMFCCCTCVLKDRVRLFGGQELLSPALAFYWMSLTLLPVAFLALLGVLILLAQHAGQTWAEEFRQSFRRTPLWQLAFWEWTGMVLAFAFAVGSVLLLPSRADARRHSENWP